jgi:uncharacterized protein RhaS with RHS repeats
MSFGRWIAFMACIGMASASLADGEQEVVDEQTGEVIRETAEDGTGSDFLLDEQGRVISERRPDGTVVRYWYDAEGTQHVVSE